MQGSHTIYVRFGMSYRKCLTACSAEINFGNIRINIIMRMSRAHIAYRPCSGGRDRIVLAVASATR